MREGFQDTTHADASYFGSVRQCLPWEKYFWHTDQIFSTPRIERQIVTQ